MVPAVTATVRSPARAWACRPPGSTPIPTLRSLSSTTASRQRFGRPSPVAREGLGLPNRCLDAVVDERERSVGMGVDPGGRQAQALAGDRTVAVTAGTIAR